MITTERRKIKETNGHILVFLKRLSILQKRKASDTLTTEDFVEKLSTWQKKFLE